MSRDITPCPRQDSNLRTRLRRPVLYPLSYEGVGRQCISPPQHEISARGVGTVYSSLERFGRPSEGDIGSAISVGRGGDARPAMASDYRSPAGAALHPA